MVTVLLLAGSRLACFREACSYCCHSLSNFGDNAVVDKAAIQIAKSIDRKLPGIHSVSRTWQGGRGALTYGNRSGGDEATSSWVSCDGTSN